ncbi:AAA domain-containing protein [Actinomycetes bacterium KLBMP 9797]
MSDSISPTDPKIVELTSGLVTYIKTLITRSTKAVRDALKEAHTVIWLDEVLEGVTPRDPRVLVEIEYAARLDAPDLPDILRGRVAAVDDHCGDEPVLTGENADMAATQTTSAVRQAYQSWLPLWREWAAAERASDRYRRLDRLAREATQRSDSHELVLGVGLVAVPGSQGWAIRRHLLITEIALETDPTTDALRLVLPLHQRLRSEHRHFLTTGDGLSPADRTPGQRFDLDLADVHPLSTEVGTWLEDWRGRCWDRPLQVDATCWSTPQVDDPATLTLAPAIFLRPRDRSRLADCYERISSELSEPEAAAPLGLAQLVVSLEREQRLRWLNDTADAQSTVGDTDPLLPLASNQQQRQVLERLSSDTAVVVQGPPGTGKTHTIANLICALLADGQRVLITSEKGQALRVLRDQLPPAVRDMCVVLSGLQRSGADELDRSITALSELTDSTNVDRLQREIHRLGQERTRLQEQLRRATSDLLRVRGEEYATHLDVGDRYAGTLRDIVTRIHTDQARYQWIGTLPDEAPEQASLTDKEALELLELIRTATPARAARIDQQLPQDLPASAQIAARVACINHAADVLGPERESGKPLMSLDDSVLQQLQRQVDQAADALAHAGLHPTLADWDHHDWRLKAANDLLGRRNRAYWSTLFADANAVGSLEQALASLAGRDVEVDPLPGDAVSPSRLLGQAKRLRRYLSRGGRFRRLWPAQAQLGAADLLEVCTVDGAAPSTVSDLAAIIAVLKTEVAVETALKAWTTAGAPVVQGNLRSRIAQLRDVNDGVVAVQQLIAARDSIEQLLRRHGVRYAIRTPMHWDLIVRVAHAGSLMAEANRAEQMLANVCQELAWWRHQDNAAPEVADLVTALQDRDLSRYAAARAQLDQARVDQEQERRCTALADRLALDHPSLLESLRREPELEAWNSRLRDFEAAWAWANAVSYHRRLRNTSNDGTLEQAIDRTQQRLLSVTADLASNQALLHCLNRMSTPQRQALQSYRSSMTKFGKGSGRHKDRHLAHARDALREATAAVPAWVMPLSVVADTIPHQHNTFDVVIVDEASQASLEALFLLWLAPRVIVVGDDRQCTPGISPEQLSRLVDERS